MKIRIISTIESMYSIKDAWDNLYQLGNYSIFQSFYFCYYSVKSNNSVLYIILLEKDNKIIEIWPCEIINKELRFINDKHADFCDILSLHNNDHVINHLISSKKFRRFHFNNLVEDSLLLKKSDKANILLLEYLFDASVLSLSKTEKFPNNFTHLVYRQKRRLRRILSKYSTSHNILIKSKESFPEKKIIKIRDVMISSKFRNADFMDDNFLTLCKNLYEKGSLLISELLINSETVALSLIYKKENKYTFWVDLYLDLSMINIYHNTIFIQNITEKEVAVFHFGRGAYKYKLQNFKPDLIPLFRFIIFNNIFDKFLFIIRKRILMLIRIIYRNIKL